MASPDDPHDPPDSPANVLGALALALTDRMSDAVAGVAGAAGHSLTAAAALSALAHIAHSADGPSVERLSQVLGLSHSGTVRLVDRLEADGYVRRARGSDGRSVAVSLTEAGLGAATDVTEARLEVLARALAPLDEDERRAFGTLVGRILVGMMRKPGATRWTCRLCDTGACGRYTGGCPIGREVAARLAAAAPTPAGGDTFEVAEPDRGQSWGSRQAGGGGALGSGGGSTRG